MQKIGSSLASPIMFDKRFIVTWEPFFIPDSRHLLSCELDNFTFKVLYCVILYKAKEIYNTFTVPCEKYKIVSFDYLVMKNIVVFPALSKFPVKLIFWFALGSVSKSCCLRKSIAIILS